GARRALPRPRAARDRRGAELRALRPTWARARRHAMELPLLAGLPLRRPRAHGGQRWELEARLQRAALRARDRARLPRRGPARGSVRHRAGRPGRERRARQMGGPRGRATEVGPQARAALRQALHRQVEESVKRGARLLLGGSVPRGPGAFYPPTILTAVDKGMPAFDEETFGP